MKIGGECSYLDNFNFEARVMVDSFVPEHTIWIMPPAFDFDFETGLYEECIRILVSPKNFIAAKELADNHNRIFNTPLMKALRETTE
jgi:hypothetical protein